MLVGPSPVGISKGAYHASRGWFCIEGKCTNCDFRGEVALSFRGAGYECAGSNYQGLISRLRCQQALPRTGNLWRCKLIT